MFQPIKSLGFRLYKPKVYKEALREMKKTFGAFLIVNLKLLRLLFSKAFNNAHS